MKKYNWDFFAVVFYSTDYIQHWFWKYWEPQYFENISHEDIKKYGDVIPQQYRIIDNHIGQILKSIDENTIIIIVSDHGFKAQPRKYFYDDFNNLLERLDLLKFKSNVKNKQEIDWSRTKAYFCEEDIYLKHKPRGFCINLKTREKMGIINPGKEFRELKQKIATLLSDVTILETKERVFSDIYIEESVNSSVDVRFKINENISEYPQDTLIVSPNNNTIQLGEFIYDSNISGTHAKSGVLLIHGKNIKRNNIIRNATVLDITPTILYLFDLPVPKDMDGKVLIDVIELDYLKKHPIRYTEVSSQRPEIIEMTEMNKTLIEKIKERLKELGYIA